MKVYEGHIANCYFIAALSLVASKPEAVRRLFFNKEVCAIVPKPQCLGSNRYLLVITRTNLCPSWQYSPQGLYGIKLFAGGQWRNVTIDDRLPARGRDCFRWAWVSSNDVLDMRC